MVQMTKRPNETGASYLLQAPGRVIRPTGTGDANAAVAKRISKAPHLVWMTITWCMHMVR